MAKLPSEKFQHKNKADEEMAFMSTLTIDTAGTFHAVIPDELAESARSLRHPGAEVSHASRGSSWRVSGKRLDDVKDFIRKAMANHMQCEVTRELVIAYNYKLDVAYALSNDGGIYQNGYAAQEAAGIPGGNNGEGYRWRGELNGSGSQCSLYRVGLGARVFEKVTYTRSTGKKVVYEHVDGFHSKIPGIQQLNTFIGLSIKPEYVETMPYTDEAAMFFYEAMRAMCSLAERVQAFMGDRTALLLAIEKRAGLMLAAPSKEREAA